MFGRSRTRLVHAAVDDARPSSLSLRFARSMALAVFVAGPWALAGGGEGGDDPRPPVLDAAQDAWKRDHVRTVAAGLAARERPELDDARRAARSAAVAALRAYAERGVFAQDPYWPGMGVSHLIDPYGTRCALAHLIDVSGSRELLLRLAGASNHAFVPELVEDAGFRAWLDANGLTADDAAWIQAPGFVDPTNGDSSPGDGSGRDVSLPTALTGGGDARRSGSVGSGTIDWKTWWEVHGERWLDLRARYHAALELTGGDEARGMRPTPHDVETLVIPFLRGLVEREQGDLRATALMAWARVARGDEGAAVVDAVLEYVRRERGPWREVMVLALGVPRHRSALEPLLGLAADAPTGRRILGRASVPDSLRSIAAIALGQLGDPAAVEPLAAVLDKADSTDLRCACWLGLAGSVRNEAGEARGLVVHRALERLRAKGLSDAEASVLPAALAIAGDPLAGLELQRVIAEFRAPRGARGARALALARLMPRLDPRLADALIATATRDPLPGARSFAIVALAELASRSAEAPQEDRAATDEAEAKAMRFLRGALAGLYSTGPDEPWVALAAGRFAGTHPLHRAVLVNELRKRAADDTEKGRQGAALIGLAIADDAGSAPLVTRTFDGAQDTVLRGWAALGLGALARDEARVRLTDLLREHPSDDVRRRAAQGLGLAADPRAVPRLVEELGRAKSRPVQAALAQAIGEIGDRRALVGLITLAGTKDTSVDVRHRAVSAIALIAQPKDRSWVRTFQEVIDPTFATPSVAFLFDLY